MLKIIGIIVVLIVIACLIIRNSQSGKKSRDLAIILKNCEPIFNQMRALQNGTFTSRMLTEKKYNPVDDLYALCMKYKSLSTIMGKYGATKDDFTMLYTYLFATCPMFSKDGNFVPVSAFAFPQTLEYLLMNKDKMENISPMYLMDYFRI